MKVLVLSQVSIPAARRTIPDWHELRALGCEVSLGRPGECHFTPDAVILMGVGAMGLAAEAMHRFPGAAFLAYHWDCYEWVWTNPRPGEYDYRAYGELLRRAKEVWVPSRCTGLRAEQWWGPLPWRVIRSCCPHWDHPAVTDRGYLLCPLREIPDPWWGVFERCCKELKIPHLMTRHELGYREYQEAVAGCRALVSPLYELSTGGLTLLEGHRLGKPVLLSDSPWHGGRDYFGDRAWYFPHGDEEAFKRALLDLYRDPPRHDPAECKAWVDAHFADAVMCGQILERLRCTTT